MKLKYIFIILFLIKNITLFAQKDPTKAVLDTVKMGTSTIIFSDEVRSDEEVEKEKETKKVEVKKEEPKKVEEPKNITFDPEDNKTIIAYPVPLADQKVNVEDSHVEVGLNMTTLLSRIIPLGDAVPLSGPTTIYLKKFKKNRAVRFGMALSSSTDANFKNAAFRVGSERRRAINDKWSFSRAIDFIWAFGNFDTPGFTNTVDSHAFGAGFGYGVEYNIAKNISVGTESTIFLGIGGGSPLNFKIIPPIALFLTMKL